MNRIIISFRIYKESLTAFADADTSPPQHLVEDRHRASFTGFLSQRLRRAVDSASPAFHTGVAAI
jgi:hypothetical protein